MFLGLLEILLSLVFHTFISYLVFIAALFFSYCFFIHRVSCFVLISEICLLDLTFFTCKKGNKTAASLISTLQCEHHPGDDPQKINQDFKGPLRSSGETHFQY